MDKTKNLKINYEEFLAVLKKADKYTYVLLLNDDGISNETQNVTNTNISELSELLWESLRLGSNEVENIFEERFVESQVEYFRNNSERLKNLVHNGLPEHINLFLRISKSAQIRIIQEGLLKPKPIDYHRERQEEIKKQRRVEKEVRDLDKSQCVFCGKERKTTEQRSYFKKTEDDFVAEKVFLSCNSCRRKNKEPKFGRFLNLNI